LAIGLMWRAGAAHACSCDPISPEAGFERAQYVFAGKVVRAESHTWLIEVERVWKGQEKLGRTAELMDVYARMDCEFFFELGQRYVFFAVVAKGGRNVFYHPQACNWTRPLRSARVPAEDDESLWLEDLIVREHGPGDPPRDERPCRTCSSRTSTLGAEGERRPSRNRNCGPVPSPSGNSFIRRAPEAHLID
jgi:hypothetical protein